MNNYKIYFALEKQIKQQGHQVSRAELVEAFTDGEKVGLSELSKNEYNHFLSWIKTSFDLHAAQDRARKDWQNTPENKMRRKIYSLFVTKMGYTAQQMYSWVIKYGKYGKPLRELDLNELTVTVTQAEKVYESFQQGLRHSI